MQNLAEIEKLHDMKEKGIISEEEFTEQKARLLRQGTGTKNQLVYCVLAFFLGTFGVHNFYAGRWKRGLTQLLLTLLTFFLGTLITYLWAIINIFTIHTDGKGQEFEPSHVGKYIFGILGIFGYLWTLLTVGGVIVIGGIAGYTTAMTKYQANELITYSSQITTMARAQNAGEGITRPVDCKSFAEVLHPEFFKGNCVAYPGGKVVFSGVDEALKRTLINERKMQEDSSGNLVFSSPF